RGPLSRLGGHVPDGVPGPAGAGPGADVPPPARAGARAGPPGRRAYWQPGHHELVGTWRQGGCGGRRDAESGDVREHRSSVARSPRSGPVRIDRHTWQQASDLPHNRPVNPVTGPEPPSTADDVAITIFLRGFSLYLY